MSSARENLLQLLSIQTERQLTESEAESLSELLRSDEELIDVYVEYMSVHGLLFWDVGAVTGLPSSSVALSQTETISETATSSPRHDAKNQSRSRLVAVMAAVLALTAGWIFISQSSNGTPEIAHKNSLPPHHPAVDTPEMVVDVTPPEVRDIKPLVLDNGRKTPEKFSPSVAELQSKPLKKREWLAASFSDAEITGRIDTLIEAGLKENEVIASDAASDSEWVRRIYLTIVGRIPTLYETQQFLDSDSPRKRQALLDHVLEMPERSAHFAGLWTNLLVGRTPRNHVNREKLYEFLNDSFVQNAPWIDTVGDLITARGRNDQNGAANFLLAHLNNQATPATAVTARLFLGEQISCVQCHDHPFAPGVTQREYWALNAFFKDTERISVPIANAVDRQMKDIPWQLVDRARKERITHFETRAGQQQAVLPGYDGQTIAEDSTENRRKRLAQLLATDSNTKVARAMVNRMWAHFFGYGFTPQIDDMGTHVAASHPELLDTLSEAFVKSGYDVRRLMIWIAASNAWQRSSEITAANAVDRPDHGETPLFSRVYVRRMTPEQVYESVRIAIRSSAGVPPEDDGSSVEHRRQWVQQFAHAYNTDENDEAMGFEGSIAQAMVMMNDVEVGEAIDQATDAIVSTARNRVAPVTETLNRLAMAMLNRKPTTGEQKVFRSHYRKLAQHSSPAAAMPSAIEDMMWAYLNSSEFVLVH